MKWILASGSPRRRELLQMAGVPFDVVTSDADESVPPGTEPAAAAALISGRKAHAAAALPTCQGRGVIGADTVVCLDGKIFGKPKDSEDAFRMLSMLSGRTHTVYTGVTVLHPDGRVTQFVEETDVCFFPLDEQQIRDYIATGEYTDKAGGYAIQGLGALLISGISGDYYNVVGLPIARLVRTLSC